MITALRSHSWSLRGRIVVLLMALSVLPLALSAYFDVRRTRAQLLAGMSALLQARAEQIVDSLDQFNQGHLNAARRIARFPDITQLCGAQRDEPGQRAEVREILGAFPASDPNIRAAGLIDEHGHVLIASTPAWEGNDVARQAAVGIALRGETTISDVYIDARTGDDTPLIAFLAPIEAGTVPSACIAAIWLNATALWDTVDRSNARAGVGSYAVVYDRQGIRIAHTLDRRMLFHPAGRLDPESLAQGVASQRFGARTEALLNDVRAHPEHFEMARAAVPNAGVTRSFGPVNKKFNYEVARRFQTVNWTVCYMVPDDAIEAMLAAASRDKILSAMALMLAAAALGWWFSWSPLRRMERISGMAAAFGAGHLNSRVGPAGHDEIGRLAGSFDNMAGQVERQASERAADLKRQKTMLQTLFDNTATPMFVMDRDFRYLLASKSVQDVIGISADRLIGKTHEDVFAREFAQSARASDEAIARERKPVQYERTIDLADGPHIYLMVKCPLIDADGVYQGILGIATDITAQRQLGEAQLRLAGIIENSADAIFCRTFDARITAWNTAARRMFGYSADEVLGQVCEAMFPPGTLDELATLFERIHRGESITRHETVRRHKDGRLIDIAATVSPMVDSHGRIVGTSSIARDITDLKRAQGRALAQLQRLQLLDQVTRAIGERQDLRSIYQVSVRSLEDQLPADFCCVLDTDAHADPEPMRLRVSCVGERSQLLATALSMSESSVVEVDGNGLSHCLAGELVYELDTARVPFPFAQQLARAGLHSLVAAPLRSENRVFGVLLVARQAVQAFSSGECEYIRQLSAHVALAAHQALLYGSLSRAYDELRLTQHSVLQKERLAALGQMASGIAHDINNAITPAMLYAENLLEREPLSAQARGHLQSIARAIDDVSSTVARMREFFRPGEAAQERLPVSLNTMVGQVVELTRARWSDMPLQRGVVIIVTTTFDPELPLVLGIESELREALVNLVFNGVDAMPQGGELHLSTRTRGTHALVEVADNGIGMDEATRQRCLEPFFTTKGERGTGLGLAMVYGTAQRHHAEVEIDSVPGAGTRIRLVFEVAGQAHARAPDTEVRPHEPVRILLVDDDPVLLESLRRALESDGHEVQAAAGGRAGIDAFRAAQDAGLAPDVVITDLGMPDVDGRQVAAAIKRASARTSLILLTGWGQRMADEAQTPANVDILLSKPPRLADLRRALAGCVARSAENELEGGS